MPQDFTAFEADPRLQRITGAHDAPCSLELWVLQLKYDKFTEERLLYGRLMPSTFESGRFNSSEDDHFHSFPQGYKAQLIKISLFCAAGSIRSFLAGLVSGSTLRESAAQSALRLSPRVDRSFANLRLSVDIGFRPVMHLVSRDYFRFGSKRLSPLSTSSADSAAITNLHKSELFLVEGRLDPALAEFSTRMLSEQTGLHFSNLDAWRLGDLELTNFPTLSDDERELVSSAFNRESLEVSIKSGACPPGFGLDIRVNFLNDSGVVHVGSVSIRPGAAYPLEVLIPLPAHLRPMLDSYEIEIDALDMTSGERRPVMRWGVHLVREIHQQMNMVSGVSVRNDWLSTALNNSHKERLNAVQQVVRRNLGTPSVIGGRQADPWVSANRHMDKVITQVVPKKSDAHFFAQLTDGNHTGRLELAEWLKKLLANHRDKQIAWFDPYMEDVGINLINQYGAEEGTYIVFTCLPQKPKPRDWLDKSYSFVRRITGAGKRVEKDPDKRIENLKAACLDWSNRLGSVSLRVVAFKFNEFHDRMLLIRNNQLEPIEGYHLSNSIQLATRNYPLLVTPIPPDVLVKTFDYLDSMLKRAIEDSQGLEPGLTVLFDSKDTPKASKARPEPEFNEFTVPRAGEVYAWWLSDQSLLKLSGEALESMLDAGGHVVDGALRGPVFQVTPPELWSNFNLLPFNSAWDAFGLILAHTHAGDALLIGAQRDAKLVQSLLNYLDSARPDAMLGRPERFCMVNMTEHLKQALGDLMVRATDPDRMFGHSITEVSWGDYYAIKCLWFSAPENLLGWICEGAAEIWVGNRRRQLGLKTAIDVITSEMHWNCSQDQLDSLLSSSNDFLRWIGYVAFEARIDNDPRAIQEINGLLALTQEEKRHLLGWLLARSERREKPVRVALIDELLAFCDRPLSAIELAGLLDSMRNPLKRLFNSPPWILKDVLAPLVEKEFVETAFAADAWFKELGAVWKDDERNGGLLFRASAEGIFTEEVGLLIAVTNLAHQKVLVNKLKKLMRGPVATIRMPLSIQISWTHHDRALVKLVWIGVLINAILSRVARPSPIEETLLPMLAIVDELAKRRTPEDWARSGIKDLFGAWSIA